MKPELTVVIPHYNGIEILDACLRSLYQNRYTDFVTILIDNGSTDGSQKFVREQFPQVQLVENMENLGYSGGCNQGINMADTEFVLLLNNDTEMPENFLVEMIAALKESETAAMVQPKILSIQDKQFFDYSGGSGGEIDIFGYPFARGRILDTVEQDKGQYNNLDSKVFWTSGCALLLKKAVTNKIGVLDKDFFAHQEEIDLNWRAQLAGYQCLVTTKTYIYHYSGYTLRSDNQQKMYLNHRNNLIMMIKNYSCPMLYLILPIRLILEVGTVLADSLLWEGIRAKAVLKSLYYIFSNPLRIWRKRKDVQKLRIVSDRDVTKNMYKGSIVFDHLVRKLSPEACVKKLRK